MSVCVSMFVLDVRHKLYWTGTCSKAHVTKAPRLFSYLYDLQREEITIDEFKSAVE